MSIISFQAGGVKPPSSAAISPSPPIIKPPTSSTYDEIMDTLRLLEEVPPALEPSTSPTVASTDGGRGSRGGGGAATGAGRLSNGKLESILSYLDQVERVEVNRSNQIAQPLPASSLLHTPSRSTNAQQLKYVCHTR